MSNRYVVMAVMLFQVGVSSAQSRAKFIDEAGIFSSEVYSLTEVMFHDVVNPPAAARFYSYAMLSAYQIASERSPTLITPAQLIKDFPQVQKPTDPLIDISFSATYAMLETGRLMIPSGGSLQGKQEDLFAAYRKAGYKKKVLEVSAAYARVIAQAVVAFSKRDGYLSLSKLRRYQPQETDSTWYPTPPEYMAAVEPNWKTVRTFLTDSCNQFSPAPPTAFNPKKGSNFYMLMNEVYETVVHLNEEQKNIARYWDCNPFANFYVGHVSVAIKKISPGGHWMNITGIACRAAQIPFDKTVQTHAMVAMGLHDSFVSCWSAKYQSDRIRPKSAVNRYIDERWEPFLETPPFPEYTSGHSVISTTSAELLTYFIGENFSFTDNTEVFFGLPERKFSSFRAAAEEAAISRLYGGIHFRDAIEQGQLQGKRISMHIIEKLKQGYALK
jgi:hypothetical protein